MRLVVNLREMLSAWLGIGLSLMPVYLWSSGGVQISHAVIFSACIAIVLFKGVRLDLAGRVLGMLVIYVAIRDAQFAIRDASLQSALPILYAFFVMVVYVVLRHWYSDERNWKWTIRGLVLATVIAIAGVILVGYGATIDSEGGRSIGTFNNPNQLGYFAVCMISIIGLVHLRGHCSLVLLAGVAAGAIFLSIASLSKAAMLSCAAAALMLGFVTTRRKTGFLVGSAVLVLLISGLYWMVSNGMLDDYRFFARISNIGRQSDDSLEARGYHVMFEAGAIELLFGYGAMRVDDLLGHEVHSTIASYFANYGIVGGLGLVAFLLLWARKVHDEFGVRGLFVICLPPMLYGVTHNGSRFTIFWLLVALTMAAHRGPAGARTAVARRDRGESLRVAGAGP